MNEMTNGPGRDDDEDAVAATIRAALKCMYDFGLSTKLPGHREGSISEQTGQNFLDLCTVALRDFFREEQRFESVSSLSSNVQTSLINTCGDCPMLEFDTNGMECSVCTHPNMPEPRRLLGDVLVPDWCELRKRSLLVMLSDYLKNNGPLG